MGKGGQSTIDTKPLHSDKNKLKGEASKTYFTREEVRKHNNKDDIWLIINEKVYDVTEFQKKHPGGSRILRIYAGEDASVSVTWFTCS